VGSIRRTPPRALRIAAVLAVAAVALPQPADARVTSTSSGSSQLSAPTGLVAAAAITDTAPSLSWNATLAAVAYRVYRDGSPIAKVTSTAYADTGLTSSGSHSYTVRAQAKGGSLSSSSTAVSVLYDIDPPSDVTALSGPAASSGSVTLQWTAATDTGGSGVVGYNVRRDGAYLGQAASPTFTDSSSVTDGSYTYQVRAEDAAGNRSANAASISVVIDSTAPTAPVSLSAPSPTTSAPVLSWPASSDRGSGVAGYRVLREGVAIATVSGTSFTDGSLTADGSYTYTVRAVDGAGNVSPLSPAATVSYSLPSGQAFYTGVSARLSTSSTSTADGNFPTIKLLSPFFRWADLEPQLGSFSWSALDADIARARASGNRLIVRLSCGADAPAWLYGSTSSGGRPATPLGLISTDPGSISGEITVPAPWDGDLLYHYGNLIQALQSHLRQFGDSTQTWRLADYVYFVSVSMPTEVGSEMPLGFGQGTYTGTYNGSYGAWNVHDANQAEWFSHAQGSTSSDKLSWLQAQIGQAWKNAVDVHMQRLTAIPSAVAYGGLLGDGMTAARWIASNDVPAYPTRLWSMTTNLQPNVRSDGSLGPYSEWSSAFSGAVKLALQNGGVVGFQAAGPKILTDCNRMAYSLDDGMQNYGMRFYEAAPSQISTCSSLLLSGGNNLQSRLAARWGG